MRKHFVVLIIGSALFLVWFTYETGTVVVGASNPAAAALANTVTILHGLKVLGLYVVFSVLVLGHGLLPRRSLDPQTSQNYRIPVATSDSEEV